MAPEGVVGALRTIHKSLRPGGLLLDLHPEPEHARVQIWTRSEVHNIGHLDATALIADTLAARAVVDALIREGLFMRDCWEIFEHVVHVSDVDTWLAYREARGSRSVLDPLLIQQARDLLAAAEGEIRVIERGYAARLKRCEKYQHGTLS